MTHLLHVNASARGDASRSLELATRFIDELETIDDGLTVDRLDVFDGSLPEFGTAAAGAKMAAFAGQGRTTAEERAWSEARAVFDRFDAAEAYVFNVPFWNAGVPYPLKQLVDVITQPGWAFAFTPESGYRGLLEGKRAFVVYTSGVYAEGLPPSFGADFTTTFFRDWLGFIGITDIDEVHFAPTVVNADVEGTRRAALDATLASAQRFARAERFAA
ncbi:FMN-dependent NADH-azoreductase [Agromyces hippuratus]|uniref:FMN dependent NADH:quinone oxidoreductase n=1 Tax=Agromyces hippuratus TaxID=286438 RepID=A0A852X170_9MICO|nr:NAD(P)H-dependent oxidoreductase [Agromyces hippuratus]NYG21893.1 FMN-dependent NADH-azoreductase [Agromyces hippuratus]